MIDPATQSRLKAAISECIGADHGVLDVLREELCPLKDAVRRIQPQISLAQYSLLLLSTTRTN